MKSLGVKPKAMLYHFQIGLRQKPRQDTYYQGQELNEQAVQVLIKGK